MTNSILGVVAALTGSLMGSVLQQPVALALVALVLARLLLPACSDSGNSDFLHV